MKLYYSLKATQSLSNVYEFLIQKNAHAAVIIHNGILDEIDKLLLFPQMGPIESELKDRTPEYRSLVVCRIYKVIYRIEHQKIYIVDIWDCRRDPSKLRQNIDF
jgi:plasmid stabilization system protein ParE